MSAAVSEFQSWSSSISSAERNGAGSELSGIGFGFIAALPFGCCVLAAAADAAVRGTAAAAGTRRDFPLGGLELAAGCGRVGFADLVGDRDRAGGAGVGGLRLRLEVVWAGHAPSDGLVVRAGLADAAPLAYRDRAAEASRGAEVAVGLAPRAGQTGGRLLGAVVRVLLGVLELERRHCTHPLSGRSRPRAVTLACMVMAASRHA